MQFTSAIPVRSFGIESDQQVPAFNGDEFGEAGRLKSWSRFFEQRLR